MLIRSASTPMLNSSRVHHNNSTELSPESDHLLHLPKPHSSPSFSSLTSLKRMTRPRSENDLRDLAVQKWKPATSPFSSLNLVGEEKEEGGEEEEDVFEMGFSRSMSVDQLFSSSGLGDEWVKEEEEREIGSHGGGHSDGRGGEGNGFSESNDGTESYYLKMIQENPGNSLLLGNYAKFLKEVKKDMVKAEEYCGRAILANPNDGNVVSMYADLIWESRRDATRAKRYHDQAVQVAPDDCYVMASYARFLWDAEDEEEENQSSTNTPDFLSAKPSHLTAVS